MAKKPAAATKAMAKVIRSRIVGHADVAPDQLLANPLNFRRHPRTQLEAVSGSLRELGWLKGVMVNQRTGHVVDGHARVEQALRDELSTIPVDYVDLSEAEERLALALLDPLTEMAYQDDEALAALLDGLEAEDPAVAAMLETLSESAGGGKKADLIGDLDEVPAPPKEPVTKLGDLMILGRHSLLCADATLEASWMRLMADMGDEAALCLTDPPYGVGLDYSEFVDTPENVAQLAKLWIPLARRFAAAVVFSPGVTRQWLYPEPDWVMCWFYGGGQLRSPWGFNCWRPFICYGKDPSLASGNGCRPDAFDLNTPANRADLDHPCPKPFALWSALLSRLSFRDDDVIIDPFAGSGTTIIAAEALNRTSLSMELDPRYCDVIIQRWERATGLKAELISSGTP